MMIITWSLALLEANHLTTPTTCDKKVKNTPAREGGIVDVATISGKSEAES